MIFPRMMSKHLSATFPTPGDPTFQEASHCHPDLSKYCYSKHGLWDLNCCEMQKILQEKSWEQSKRIGKHVPAHKRPHAAGNSGAQCRKRHHQTSPVSWGVCTYFSHGQPCWVLTPCLQVATSPFWPHSQRRGLWTLRSRKILACPQVLAIRERRDVGIRNLGSNSYQAKL